VLPIADNTLKKATPPAILYYVGKISGSNKHDAKTLKIQYIMRLTSSRDETPKLTLKDSTQKSTGLWTNRLPTTATDTNGKANGDTSPLHTRKGKVSN
jgi:hypothetical protein